MSTNEFDLLLERLEKIEAVLASLVDRETVKDWYSIEEAARILGKAEFTVREWCRLGRINAEKKGSGRGKYRAWVVSHDELLRIQQEGLLPSPFYKSELAEYDALRREGNQHVK